MAVNELQARITADTSSLEKSLDSAQKSFDKLGKKINSLQKDIADNIRISQGYEKAMADLNRELKNGNISQSQYQKGLQRLRRDEKETGIATDGLRKRLSNLKREQRELGAAGVQGAQGVAKIGKGAANATPALTSFSQVVQDAPYGIQGVANNIQQLTMQFGHLQKSAGGTRAALKLMLSSLSGPAGILLAVSLATTLLIQFGDELFASAKKAEKLQKKLETLNDSFDAELRLSEAIEESLELQGKSTVGILKARKEIIGRQLQGLTNLIEEQKSLLNIQRIENERVSNMEILAQEAKKVGNFLLAAAKTAFDITLGASIDAAEKLLNFEIDRSKYQAASKEDKEEENKLQQQLNNLLAQQQELQNDILSTNKEIQATVRPQVSAIDTSAMQGLTPLELNTQISADTSGLTPPAPDIDIEQYQAKLQTMKDITQQTTGLLQGAFGQLATGISGSLDEGESSLDRFTSTLASGVIKVLATYAAQAVGAAIAGGASSGAATGPGAIVAIPTMIAGLLAVVLGAFASIPKFAGGGIVPGGSYSGDKVPAFLNSSEMVLNGKQQSRLFGMLDGSLSNIRGGRESLQLQASTVLRGSDILLSVNRAGKKNDRFYGR